MPSFLSDIDNVFNMILRQNNITKKDLIKLKSIIIEAYENDNVNEVKSLYISMKKIEF